MNGVVTKIDRMPRTVWIGVACAAIYILIAAGFSTLLEVWFAPETETADFALTHLIPLPIIIAAGLWFAYSSGWWSDIWRETPTYRQKPQRLWLVVIPAALVVQILLLAVDVPWADRTLGLILIVLVGTLLVGFGEEFFFRGILVTALRARHGEFVTLLITTGVFALAHIPGSIITGVPPAFIAFQVAGLATVGATYYWVRRVTGRLWVAMLVHAFTDFVLYLGAGSDTPSTPAAQEYTAPDSAVLGTIGVLLWIALAIGVVSVIREDRRTRRQPLAE